MIVIHEVMNHVILLHELSETRARGEMVNRVVRVIVAEIADQKRGEKRLQRKSAQE